MELHTDQYCLFECVHFWLFPLVCLPGCCVNLVLNCQVKEINAALERKVREEVMKVLDQRENEYLPQVILDTMEVSMKVAACLESLEMSRNLIAVMEIPG